MEKRWQTVDVDEAAARCLTREQSIPLAIARLLVGRGVAELDCVRDFLTPRLSALSDPFLLPDMETAVLRIWRAVDGGERIVVFGDYDVDGLTSTALLISVLEQLGGTVVPFLPHRDLDGYGLSLGAVARCIEQVRPSLIVTVDCGTCSAEAVAYARSQSVDAVVTDHHEIAGTPAAAVAVVNPRRSHCSELHGLAGVGVAFKLCHALVKRGLAESRGAVRDIDLRRWLDLVAIGTVADVVPLTGENRILARHGIRRLTRTASTGLRALKEVAGVDQDCTAYHIGFVLGPRLNAAGRLGSAEGALELLTTTDAGRARELARLLDADNRERREIEVQIKDEAVSEIDAYFDPVRDFGLVAGREGWHIGAIGIVASRICKRFARPAVVVGFDDEGCGRGSCRSIEAIDMVNVLQECSDLLLSFGGHKMAAGLRMDRDKFESFRLRFNAVCAARLAGEDLRPCIRIDAWLDGLGEADECMVAAMEGLRPFGMGNPTPVWGVRNVHVMGRPRVVGNGHLKLTVSGGGSQIDAIAFGMGDRAIPETGIDMLFQLQQNTFRGRTALQLNVKDFRPTET